MALLPGAVRLGFEPAAVAIGPAACPDAFSSFEAAIPFGVPQALLFRAPACASLMPKAECWPVLAALAFLSLAALACAFLSRRRLARRLAAEKARCQALVENLPEAVAWLDRQLRFSYVSPQAARIFGVDAAAHPGRSVGELPYPPEAAKACEDAFNKAMTTRKAVEAEFQLDSACGRRTVNLRVVPDAGGGLLAIGRDVTEISSVRRDFNQLFDSMNEAFAAHEMLFDAAGRPEDYRFLMVNSAFERLTGLPAAAVVGKTVLEAIPGTEREWIDLYGQVVRTGEPLHVVRKSAQIGRWFDVRAYRNAPGRFVCLFTDVTEAKEAEEALIEARDALASRNKQLAAALANAERLAIEAKSANEAKSAFLAQMSHEICTPLNGVVGMANVLAETSLDAEQREYVEIIRRSGRNLLGIINDILDLSRVESGRMELVNAPFALSEALEEVFEPLALRAFMKGVEFAYFIDPALPEVVIGDPSRVRQVLSNISGNAVKFTERGCVVATITLSKEDARGAWARFEIKDSGVGIPPEAAAQIFSPFTQARATDATVYGGSGLGLAIAKRLCELMGGSIGFESAEGAGSTFWFEIPFQKDDSGLNGERQPLPASFAGARILVADGAHASRRCLARMLAAWGCSPVEASTSAEALDAARASRESGAPLAAALVDVNLPETGGIDLAPALQEAAGHPAPPLVLLYPIGSSPERRRSRKAGFHADLSKPPRVSHTRMILDSVLSGASGLPPGRAPEEEPARRPSAAEARSASPPAAFALIVDDDPINRVVMQTMLDRLGLACSFAENGEEAVAAVAAGAFDIVLMDIQMPVLDGLAACRRIRGGAAGEDKRAIPIIAVTAHAIKGEREKYLAAGMDDYLAKPIQMEEMGRAINAQMSRRRAAGPPPLAHGA